VLEHDQTRAGIPQASASPLLTGKNGSRRPCKPSWRERLPELAIPARRVLLPGPLKSSTASRRPTTCPAPVLTTRQALPG